MECKNSAGFWIRLGAGFVDGLIIAVVTAILSNLIYGEYITENYFNPPDLFTNLYFIILPVIWSGYTIGKWVAGIRIVRVDGKKTGIGTMLLRELIGPLIYALTFGIALIVSIFMVVLREDSRSIHDFIAGTYVTHDPPEKK
ncbi:RDD family protein [Evansella clarkii]|uniref:RDD family protein n=1 Tax=Evansella clarkii TaxID=79879 RepID=UPI0009974635|nr:RDD family protein [Evansella clarkii]